MEAQLLAQAHQAPPLSPQPLPPHSGLLLVLLPGLSKSNDPETVMFSPCTYIYTDNNNYIF